MSQKQTEVYINKTKAILFASIVLVSIIFVIIVAMNPEWFVSDTSAISWRLFLVRYGSPVFVVLLCIAFFLLLKPIFHIGPWMIISEKELDWVSLPKSYTLSWDKIENIQVVYHEKNAFLRISLKDPKEYKQHVGWFGKWMNDLNIKNYGGTFFIALGVSMMKQKDFEKAILDAFEASKGTIEGSKEWFAN